MTCSAAPPPLGISQVHNDGGCKGTEQRKRGREGESHGNDFFLQIMSVFKLHQALHSSLPLHIGFSPQRNASEVSYVALKLCAVCLNSDRQAVEIATPPPEETNRPFINTAINPPAARVSSTLIRWCGVKQVCRCVHPIPHASWTHALTRIRMHSCAQCKCMHTSISRKTH